MYTSDQCRLTQYALQGISFFDIVISMFAVSPKKRRHLKGPGYEKLHEPMGVARVESHRDSGLAGLPMGPTIRRTGIERRAGRPLPEPDVDALPYLIMGVLFLFCIEAAFVAVWKLFSLSGSGANSSR